MRLQHYEEMIDKTSTDLRKIKETMSEEEQRHNEEKNELKDALTQTHQEYLRQKENTKNLEGFLKNEDQTIREKSTEIIELNCELNSLKI